MPALPQIESGAMMITDGTYTFQATSPATVELDGVPIQTGDTRQFADGVTITVTSVEVADPPFVVEGGQ